MTIPDITTLRSRVNNAAYLARTVYPGPVDELLRRELRAWLDIGHRFDRDGLVSKVADDVLARAEKAA